MSGANEQERDTGGRRGWWLVGLLAVIGAAAGAFAGYRLDPDVRALVPSLAVAGFGLGGLIGLLLLAPVGLWRAWVRRARRRAAPPVPDGTGLGAAAGPEREAAPPVPQPAVIEAPADEETEPQPPEEPAPVKPEPEPAEPPPPAGEEPGWYPDPDRDGVRRYWDGQAWTGHVWRGRTPERTRKARSRR